MFDKIRIKNIPDIEIYGNFDDDFHHVGIISINFKGIDGAFVADDLFSRYDIETRAGAHCAPLIHEYYHTSSQVRFSFGLNNTKEEVEKCIQALQQLGKEYQE